MKKIFKITFYIIFLSTVVLYLGIVFLLPQVVNNKAVINKIQTLIYDESGVDININGLKLKISPKFDIDFKFDSLKAQKDNASIIDINTISIDYELLRKNLVSINVDNIYIDGNTLKQFKKTTKKDKKEDFNLDKIPEIHIKKLVYKSDEADILAQNIDTSNDIIKLNVEFSAPYLKESLKLGDSGFLKFEENKFKANQFKISLGNSNLYLNGVLFDKNSSLNFDLKGKNLPVFEIMPILLHLQKSKDPSRKFIENFKNYKGVVDVDLKFNKNGVWGKCIAHNLGANAVWFNIPLFFKEAVFDFKGKTVKSVAYGILGNEKVTHTLNVTNLGTPEKTVVGTMDTTLTKKFRFVPDLTVLNSVKAGLVYKIKYKKPDVYYNIEIPVNSDLIYNSFYLGLKDYKRNIKANTLKDGNKLQLKEFKYYYSDLNKENIVVFGDGLFLKNVDKKNPDKFVVQYINCHTNGYAPISVTGSFGEKVKGGKFKGDLKYDFKNNEVVGTFDIVKARHKAFLIDSAHVIAKNGLLNITTVGLFKGQKYSAELKAKNNIKGETLVYDMKLFLDKLIIETKPDKDKKIKKPNPKEISKKVKDIAITINKWEILINEIKRESFILHNVKLLGSMKNDIFDFSMKDLNFADGTIHAKGIYDFTKNISKMTFEANNINSDKVAEMTLNLKHQIEGIAKAKVDIFAKDMFRFIDAHCVFEVKEGFLPKLGDTEFMIKDSKYKLSNIVNFDFTQKELVQDDIKGSFDVHQTELKNINITTWHKLSSMFLEGCYDMEKQYADLHLFWHYSKVAPKGIRILGIPLGLILKIVFRPENSREIYKSKLSKIPKIDADDKNSNYYRIHLEGDINKNKTKLIFKEIR